MILKHIQRGQRSCWVRSWNRRYPGANVEILKGAGKRGSRWDRFLRFAYRKTDTKQEDVCTI